MTRQLAYQARREAAKELLRRRQIVSVLNALAAAGVGSILLKGTPLAYTVYEVPSSRSRVDTDLLIRRADLDAARHVMSTLGYAEAAMSGGELLFAQVQFRRTDDFDIEHSFDVHWRISTQSMFADVLTYDELAAAAIAVPELGPHGHAAGYVHALLLACIHPVMHHRNVENLVWTYDVHLLASRLSGR